MSKESKPLLGVSVLRLVGILWRRDSTLLSTIIRGSSRSVIWIIQGRVSVAIGDGRLGRDRMMIGNVFSTTSTTTAGAESVYCQTNSNLKNGID